MMRTIALLALVALPAGLALQLSSDDQASKERPVTKVINLLKEMQATLEKEADEDQAVYDAMACWCETNEKAKTKAVADGTQLDKDLTAKIPELAAKGAQLKVEIEQLTKESKQNEEALAEATELRAKELGAFRQEETDSVATITGLKNAVQALSKPNAALTQATLLQVQKALGATRREGALRGVPASKRRLVAAFLQQGPALVQEHGPSSEIFGVLKGMKESFEQNLEKAQTEEKDAVETFASLKSTKTQEIATAKQQVFDKTAELADTDEKREDSKETLEDTRSQVTADQAFLLDLQQRCGSMDKQFADRQKMRGEEVKAVGEALEILTDDDAKDLVSRSTGFVQLLAVSTESARRTSARDQAARILREAAKKTASPQLALLATSVKEDVFAKIKEIVDKLIVQLKKEQEDDVLQRDECIDTLNTNEKEIAASHSVKGDLEVKIEDLSLLIEKASDEVAVAKEEIAATQKEMKIASENREKENHDFQLTVTDQRATQELLAKALKKLEAVYKAAALAQVTTETKVHAGQAPPQGFGEYKKAGGAGGVMGMIENIIAESKQVETEAVAAETEAQQSYETFIKDSNDAIDALTRGISDKMEAMSKADAEKIRTESDLEKTNKDIDALETFRRTTQGGCDFLLKNFEVRQASRTQEIEALDEAKAVMSGASV